MSLREEEPGAIAATALSQDLAVVAPDELPQFGRSDRNVHHLFEISNCRRRQQRGPKRSHVRPTDGGLKPADDRRMAWTK